jgi:intraflagellar transport protein 140
VNDPRLFVWDIELDLVQTFDFTTGRNDQDTEKTEQSLDVAGRYPNLQYWDPSEPKLLVCQAVLAPGTVPDQLKLDTVQEDSKNTEVLVRLLKCLCV